MIIYHDGIIRGVREPRFSSYTYQTVYYQSLNQMDGGRRFYTTERKTHSSL